MRRFLVLVGVVLVALLPSSLVSASSSAPLALGNAPVQPGVHTYSHSVPLNAKFCARMAAEVPLMRGQPCTGTLTIKTTSSLSSDTVASSTTATPYSGTFEVDAEFCGNLDYWCFSNDAYWSFVYPYYDWVSAGPWCGGYTIGGGYNIQWCGSYNNYTYTSQSGINVQLNYIYGSWSAGMRTFVSARYGVWVNCWGNGGGPCG